MRIALTESGQESPFETAEVGSTGLGQMFLEQLKGATEIAGGERLLGEVDIGDVFVNGGGAFFLFGLTAEYDFMLASDLGVMLGMTGADRLPNADGGAANRGRGNDHPHDDRGAMAADEFFQAI